MINKAIILGNLGAEPEIKQTQSGNGVATFNVATTERWRGQDGQPQEQTEWHRIVTFGRLSEICGQYLQKGSKVYIEGRLQTRQWQDQNGNNRYTTEIVAREMKMLDSRQSSSWQNNSEMPSTDSKESIWSDDKPYLEDDVPF